MESAKVILDDIRCDVAVYSLDGRMIASSQVSEYQGIRPSYGKAMLRYVNRPAGNRFGRSLRRSQRSWPFPPTADC